MTKLIKPSLKRTNLKKSLLPQKPKKPHSRKGFSYTVSWDQIKEYQTWPYEKRLQWLLMGNLLRKSLPSKTIELQDAFRKGLI